MRRRIWRGWILCLCACLLLCGAASGTGSTPPDAVSRGAFADALYDAHVAHGGAPVVSEGSSAPFRDVGSWSPYFEALCWAKASGIAGGYAGGAFRPAAPVTRQQATVMLYRYAKTTDLPLEKGSDRDLAGYRDADTIPTWSREAVQWAVRNGLWFSGSATELQAAENVSWEELAVLTQRLFLGGMPAAALSAAPEGLTMELQQCTTTGAVVVLQNAAEETFSYGADYGLYRQVNGGWYQMNKEMDTIAMAYELARERAGSLPSAGESWTGAASCPPGPTAWRRAGCWENSRSPSPSPLPSNKRQAAAEKPAAAFPLGERCLAIPPRPKNLPLFWRSEENSTGRRERPAACTDS